MSLALRHLEVDPAAAVRLLRPFWKEGQVLRWPARPRRLPLLLAEVVQAFPLGLRIPEREVDSVLRGMWADHCQLRRALVDYEFLGRKDGVYWRVG